MTRKFDPYRYLTNVINYLRFGPHPTETREPDNNDKTAIEILIYLRSRL
jgi:hypothetical protein